MTSTSPANHGVPHIGWGRAVGTGLLILAVGFGVTVGVTNAVMTGLQGLSRDLRQWIVTAVFVVVVVGMGIVLRRLQARGVV